ncbi:MAG: DUF3108 domain-containing protein [Candidatus Cloacimonadales bacterium]|jgi:hypothetical protein|nr:DUF3108 domain-containing protein [Candidatus Cloacimonadota bacterium]MDD2650347.1 DUF3108 domain-containing protein [Candidatus Cloacimonadota bacterium]MDD3501263.1 DUF3108 domain-containing protein [Candidatus Cloacimonadota bacterium]MDX9976914.1 DUF3108 domain-containing protein [Candidatus Cloacimonadales bacterium]
MKTKVLIIAMLVLSPILQAFQNDEKLSFDIKYGFITAGHASLELHETTYNGRPVWEISSNASTNSFFDNFYKVRDKINSIWDKERHVSYVFSKNLHEGKYKQKRTHTYYPNAGYTIYAKYSFKEKKFYEEKFTIPKNTQDIFSAFYYTRQHDLNVGDTLQISVTTDGKSYNALVCVLQREKIKTIFGEIDCLKIQPDLIGESIFKQSGNIYIWLTDDDEKIPVLLESKVIFGSFKAVLVKAENVKLQTK